MHFPKRSLLVVGVIASLLVGGVAAAAWLASGTGPANGQALTASGLVVTARSGTADLYPAGPAGSVYFTVQNPNPYSVTLTSASYGAISGGAAGCTPTSANIVLAGAAPTTITPSLVVAGGATVNGVLAGVLSMPGTAADLCQGAVFTIQVTVSGLSS